MTSRLEAWLLIACHRLNRNQARRESENYAPRSGNFLVDDFVSKRRNGRHQLAPWMSQLFSLAPRFPSFRGFWRRFRLLDPRPLPSGRLAASPITPESNRFANDGVHFFSDLLGLRSGVPLAATAGALSVAGREAFGL